MNRTNGRSENVQGLSFLECHECLNGLWFNFGKRLNYFETLPAEQKLVEMKKERKKIELRRTILHLDFVGSLDKMIEIEENELELVRQQSGIMPCGHNPQHPPLCQAAGHQPPAFSKLEVNCETRELVVLLKRHLLTAKNAKGLPMVDMTNKDFGIWICNAFRLEDAKELVIGTILNDLSRR